MFYKDFSFGFGDTGKRAGIKNPAPLAFEDNAEPELRKQGFQVGDGKGEEFFKSLDGVNFRAGIKEEEKNMIPAFLRSSAAYSQLC